MVKTGTSVPVFICRIKTLVNESVCRNKNGFKKDKYFYNLGDKHGSRFHE